MLTTSVGKVTVEEAARRLGRNPELVRRWLREGRLKGEAFGHVWAIDERELARFAKSAPERRDRGGRRDKTGKR
jgi:excisionase family DNA binding protein